MEPFRTPLKSVTIPLYFDGAFDAKKVAGKWGALTAFETADSIGYTPKSGCAVDFANVRMWKHHHWCYLPFSKDAAGEGWVNAAFENLPFADLPPPGCVPADPHTMDEVLRQIVESCDCGQCQQAKCDSRQV
eukprot:338354-Rhodomonas_salina.3